MNLGLESLHALAEPIVNAAIDLEQGSVYNDIDFSDEICAVASHNEMITDLQETITNLVGVCNVVKEKGCSRELIALCGEELSTIGIDLSPGAEAQVTASLEALIGNIKLEDIKKTLMKIIDSIVRIIQKVSDHNKRDSNTLIGLIEGRLSDIEKIHIEKFSSVIVTAYPREVFMTLVDEFSDIDLDTEVGSDASLKTALSPKLISLLKSAGWEVGDRDIVRAEKNVIMRERTKVLGWEVSHLRNAAMKTKATLDHLRVHDRRIVDKQKREVGSLQGDMEKVDAARNKLRNLMQVIVTVDRLSLILSRQMINLVESLKDKS